MDGRNQNEGQGFRQIGDLTRAIVKPGEDSASPMERSPQPSRNLPTIGLPSQASAEQNSTGTQLSEIVSVRLPPALSRLETLAPAEVNRLLVASLPQSVRSELHEKTVDRTTKEYGFDVELVGYTFGGRAPAADVAAALAILEKVNEPCPEEIAEKAVATLRVRTARRAEVDDDMALTIAVYAQDLSEYPADVVVDACKAWARQNKWFPTCSELRDMCEWRAKKRRFMRDALLRGTKC